MHSTCLSCQKYRRKFQVSSLSHEKPRSINPHQLATSRYISHCRVLLQTHSPVIKFLPIWHLPYSHPCNQKATYSSPQYFPPKKSPPSSPPATPSAPSPSPASGPTSGPSQSNSHPGAPTPQPGSGVSNTSSTPATPTPPYSQARISLTPSSAL